jgi:hypothetical protein
VSSRSHARRNELARERGFLNYYEQAKAPRRITGYSSLARLPDAAQLRRKDALRVVSLMRREGLELAAAARREHVPRHVVTYYAREALTGTSGSSGVRRADRMYRRMTIVSGGQVIDVDVRGSQQASVVSDYWNTGVHPYLEPYADDTGLLRMRGVSIGGFELETDLEILDELARRGLLDVDAIYRLAEQ